MDAHSDDPIALAWDGAPMGQALSVAELALAEEGLAAIEAGETATAAEVRAELDARHQTAG